jgi:hypothetical protein
VDAVADSLSINNRMFFNYDSAGTQQMMERERRSRNNFYDRLSDSLSGEPVDLQKDYFVDENLEKKPKEQGEPKEPKRFSLKNLFRNTNK